MIWQLAGAFLMRGEPLRIDRLIRITLTRLPIPRDQFLNTSPVEIRKLLCVVELLIWVPLTISFG